MKNPAASGLRAEGLLATTLRPKPYSGFFRMKVTCEWVTGYYRPGFLIRRYPYTKKFTGGKNG
jgi:hypothetical protein